MPEDDDVRYRNIWPFEHARVRLRKRRSSDDDYINASFVQPLGTTKKYIATQGPLPAVSILTFRVEYSWTCADVVDRLLPISGRESDSCLLLSCVAVRIASS
jgi:hypothetical protein